MQITQLRNATIIIHANGHRILVDPMLARAGALPPLRVFDGKRQRNPLVDLPAHAHAKLAEVTHCLITHCQKGHFDHLDRAGKQFLRERQIPVFCTQHDTRHLRSRGLHVQPLPDRPGPHPFLGGTIETVRCVHGHGLVGAFMEHGVGYLIALPGQPTLYLAGDTILTSDVERTIVQHQPDISVVPAGGARFDLGGEIIMGPQDVVALARLSRGIVVANHLEAISHCPPTRDEVRALAVACGAGARVKVPLDGDTLDFSTIREDRHAPVSAAV